MRAGWQELRLADVCEFRPSKDEVRARIDGTDRVSFAPMEDLGIGRKFLEPQSTRSLSEVAGSYTYFADGDVLLAKITPCFENGKLGIARNLTNGAGFGSSEYIVFRPDERLLNEYLYYFLSRDDFRTEGAERMSGAVGHKRVSKDFIEQYRIPLPPLPEQHRIVAILDQAFESIATAKANTERSLRMAWEVFESHREATLGTVHSGWEERPLAELCDIKHGFAFEGEYFAPEGEYVLLTPGNFFESGGYRDRGAKQKYYIGTIPTDYVLRERDLLVAMTEQAAGLLGSPILVPEADRFLHNQRLGLVQPKPNAAWSNEFFFHVFNRKPVRDAIHASASGVKVRHTSPTKIGAVSVAYPTGLAEQRRIAGTLEEVANESVRLASLSRQKLAALDELKSSLLHHAFHGDL